MNDRITVCGAGGFIGGHLISCFKQAGISPLRAIDIKPLNQWFQLFDDVENLQLDLRGHEAARTAVAHSRYVYNFAADMGGMGFIENNKALCMLNVLINTHLLMASCEAGVSRFLFASSACVYPANKQTNPNVSPLKEADAYPAMPEDGYGWEKLFSERMCRHFEEDFGLTTRVARYHNVYGPLGTWNDGREKAPAAICRKVIEAKLSGRNEIVVWGSGEQTRSFQFIEDAIYGTQLIMHGDCSDPINLGSNELVSINQLVDIVEEIAGVKLHRLYDARGPKGVNGRNSDNTLIKKLFSWEPSIKLRVGLERTYSWIYDQMVSSGDAKSTNRSLEGPRVLHGKTCLLRSALE